MREEIYYVHVIGSHLCLSQKSITTNLLGKEAVSGTTLVDNGPKSYISRLQTIAPKTPCDVFVCQAVTYEQWKLWMGDAVHPTRAGYPEWWTPMFQEILYSYCK